MNIDKYNSEGYYDPMEGKKMVKVQRLFAKTNLKIPIWR